MTNVLRIFKGKVMLDAEATPSIKFKLSVIYIEKVNTHDLAVTANTADH